LESVCTLTGTVGSNPTLSAINFNLKFTTKNDVFFIKYRKQKIKIKKAKLLLTITLLRALHFYKISFN